MEGLGAESDQFSIASLQEGFEREGAESVVDKV